MRQYLDLVRHVLVTGERRADRTGTGTVSAFGTQLRVNLQNGFPAVTTKRLYFGQVAAELASFLNQRETLAEFHAEGCNVWDKNVESIAWQTRIAALKDTVYAGRDYCSDDWVGRHYGLQWRAWRDPVHGRKIDQLRNAIEILRADPTSRRAYVTAWNPAELEDVCLPPCHVSYQFSVRDMDTQPRLDCAVTMRSVDVFLGMPFDIASYALLMHLVAKDLRLEAGWLTMWFGDTHIYVNHLNQMNEQLTRDPQTLPTLALDPMATIDSFRATDCRLVGYEPHPPIRGELSV